MHVPPRMETHPKPRFLLKLAQECLGVLPDRDDQVGVRLTEARESQAHICAAIIRIQSTYREENILISSHIDIVLDL